MENLTSREIVSFEEFEKMLRYYPNRIKNISVNGFTFYEPGEWGLSNTSYEVGGSLKDRARYQEWCFRHGY